MLSSAASSVGLPSIVYAPPPVPRDPLAPLPPRRLRPLGIDPRSVPEGQGALDRIATRRCARLHRHRRFLEAVERAALPRRRPDERHGGEPSASPTVAVRIPITSGFLERFSNEFGSYATSNGAYTTGDYYHGKYGLSMKVHGLDWSNNNAEARAIVIHNAWYAEPEMIAQHGKLGRCEGCFAFSRASQWDVMRKLAGGRMIYADKLA